MIRALLALSVIAMLAGCSQAGNTANSLCVVWVGAGTSATCTLNAQTSTTPAAAPVLPSPVVVKP